MTATDTRAVATRQLSAEALTVMGKFPPRTVPAGTDGQVVAVDELLDAALPGELDAEHPDRGRSAGREDPAMCRIWSKNALCRLA